MPISTACSRAAICKRTETSPPCATSCANWGASAQPTPETLKRYALFLEAGFEPRTVTAAAVALNAQNRHRFEDLERLLTQWAEKGLFRADAAEAYLQRQRALQMEMIELLRLAGSDRTPGYSDIALFEGWKARFSPEMLRLAAEAVARQGRGGGGHRQIAFCVGEGGRFNARTGARAAGAPGGEEGVRQSRPAL